MGLDVYLTGEEKSVSCECPRCENKHERIETEEFYSANITHNLNTMAEEAGIYTYLWRPEELGITKARELIDPLEIGLILMKNNPERFKKLDPKNGWGSYGLFVPWVESYLKACKEHPDADVNVSR